MSDISISTGKTRNRDDRQSAGRRFDRLGHRLRALRRLVRIRKARGRHPRWAIEDARMLRDIGIDPSPPHWYRWLVELTRR
jgi:hypothetical protein